MQSFFLIKKPRNPTAQSQTFSSFKQHNTFKALVLIHQVTLHMFQNCGEEMYVVDTLTGIVDSWIPVLSGQGMKLWLTGDFSLEIFLKRERN